MRYLLLALFTVFSLSALAGKPTKEQTAREPALQGVDTCEVSIDQAGAKRQQQSAQKQQECRTFNESRSNNLRGAGKAKEAATLQKSSEAGIAATDPGVPSDKAAGAKK
jgi:hypothetical protein